MARRSALHRVNRHLQLGVALGLFSQSFTHSHGYGYQRHTIPPYLERQAPLRSGFGVGPKGPLRCAPCDAVASPVISTPPRGGRERVRRSLTARPMSSSPVQPGGNDSHSIHSPHPGRSQCHLAGWPVRLAMSKNLSGCSGVCRVWQWGTVLGIAGPVPTLLNAVRLSIGSVLGCAYIPIILT